MYDLTKKYISFNPRVGSIKTLQEPAAFLSLFRVSIPELVQLKQQINLQGCLEDKSFNPRVGSIKTKLKNYLERKGNVVSIPELVQLKHRRFSILNREY